MGPHRRFNHPALDAAPLRELAPRVLAAIQRADERTYRAPSPWHAAAWLLDLAALIGQVADLDGETGLRSPYAAKYGAPVFRGQRALHWKLTPTLLREPCDPLNVRALELFIQSVSELFRYEENRMNTRHVHMAAAQHYGMATPLLDFTADPRVAVFFACQGAEPHREREVVVYGTPFNVLADLGGAVVLPPPWVKRLYAQRGLFLDCAELPEDVDLRDLCFRVIFPPDERYGRSVFVEGAQALLPPDPWYARATEWAREAARVFDPSKSSESPGEILRRECGPPPFLWDALVPAAMRESLDQFVDMCEWLALKVVNGTPTYDCTALEYMWRHNEPLFRSHRVLWQFLRNLFPHLEREHFTGDRMLAAMEAVSRCVEDEEAGAGHAGGSERV